MRTIRSQFFLPPDWILSGRNTVKVRGKFRLVKLVMLKYFTYKMLPLTFGN